MTPEPRPSEMVRDTLSRIAEFGGCPIESLNALASYAGANVEHALQNFERWLRATSSPGMQLENALVAREPLTRLLTLIGASQPVADLLIQNPELAHFVLEPEPLDAIHVDSVLAEGRALVAAATSYSHALDRIRFLKQRWTLPIVVNDLFGGWTQEAVWRGLSDLAGAIVGLAMETVAKNVGVGSDALAVVAFGKLGGGELNYSSDVDLVYVAEPGRDVDERQLQRLAEAFGRALSDRSGRGSLYRVDLRLRPYGGAGPLTPTADAIEAYYERYAEPWEVLALLRSRVVLGSDDLKARWDRLREATCFKSALGEPALEAVLAMRVRIEQESREGDLKRGSGGIRDVEFLVQILQLVHGFGEPDLRVRSTLEAIRAMDRHGILDHAVCHNLAEGYEFLRRLEHRCQLLGDRQTHELPADRAALGTVASLMGTADVDALLGTLQAHRRTLEGLYTTYLRPGERGAEGETARDALHSRLGPAGLAWFDSFPLSEEFYSALVVNRTSLERVERILRRAPSLVQRFRRSTPLTELLLSGELEEEGSPIGAIRSLPTDYPVDRLAEAYVSAHTKTVAKWVLNQESDLGADLSELADAVLVHVCRRLYVEADILALGSYARFELTPESDLDLVCLVAEPDAQPAAESAVQGLVALLGRLRRSDAPIDVDLRLRPDGGKGLLVRSYAALKAYDLEGMELWERFALGQARLVIGATRAVDVVADAAFGLPLTPERLAELVAMKRRVETERVKPQHKHRDVKLGRGGLGDIEWFVHLHEMRYPTALGAGTLIRLEDRIRAMARAALINAVEAEELLEAHTHLLRTRLWLVLQGIQGSIVPENPDKLARLAESMGFEDGNAFLARHEAIVTRVRQIYEDGLAGLRV